MGKQLEAEFLLESHTLGSVFTMAIVIGPLNLLGSNNQMVQRLDRKLAQVRVCMTTSLLLVRSFFSVRAFAKGRKKRRSTIVRLALLEKWQGKSLGGQRAWMV
jgi:hypothetical protein